MSSSLVNHERTYANVAREIRTLLLVDNSATTLFYWGMLLKRLDYKVVSKRSAEAALQVMETAVPAVVLTDIPLSGDRDGVALLKEIKSDPRFKDIPVVMLTSVTDAAVKGDCERLGCAAWIGKDAEPDALYETLQSLSETMPRHHIRLNTSLKVIVGDSTVAGGSARTEYASAISEGGLYVRTQYPQPQNALTPVRILLDGVEVRARALVLYSYAQNAGPYKEPGMGLKFEEISDQDRRLIRLFIKKELTRDIAH